MWGESAHDTNVSYSYRVLLISGEFVSTEIHHVWCADAFPVSSAYRVSPEMHTDWKRQQQENNWNICGEKTSILNRFSSFSFMHYSHRTCLHLRVRMQRLTGESGAQVSSCEGAFKCQEQHGVLEQRRLWEVKGQLECSSLIFLWWRKQDMAWDKKRNIQTKMIAIREHRYLRLDAKSPLRFSGFCSLP